MDALSVQEAPKSRKVSKRWIDPEELFGRGSGPLDEFNIFERVHAHVGCPGLTMPPELSWAAKREICLGYLKAVFQF
jgi:hypothetical protein